jgi:hypothetical protein
LSLTAFAGSWDLAVAVGESGVAITWDGRELHLEHAARDTDLNGVWVSASGLAYAIGDDGMVVRSRDGTWGPSACPGRALYAVDGSGETVVAVGAAGTLVVLVGDDCRTIPTGITEELLDVFAADADTFVAVSENSIVRASNGVVTSVHTTTGLGVASFRSVAGLGPEAYWVATGDGTVLDGTNDWRREAMCVATNIWSSSEEGERIVASSSGCVATREGWRIVPAVRQAAGGFPLGSDGGEWLVLSSARLELRAADGDGLHEPLVAGALPRMSPLWQAVGATRGSVWLSGPGLHVFAAGSWTYAEIEEPPLSSQELLAGVTAIVPLPDGSALAASTLGLPARDGALLRITREGLVTEHIDLGSGRPTGLAVGADIVTVGLRRGHVIAGGVARAISGTGRAELTDVCASEEGAWLVGVDGAVFFLAAGATRARRVSSGVTERLVDCACDAGGNAWVVGLNGAVLRCSSASCDEVDRRESSLVATMVLGGQPWVFGGSYAAQVTPDGLRPVDVGIGSHRVVEVAAGPDAGWLMLSSQGLVRIGVGD